MATWKQRPLLVRLNAKIEKMGPDECWNWKGKTNIRNGYGSITSGFPPKLFGVHRLAFEQTGQPIPKGQSVLHTCDNPRCCNPAHLFLGSQADNMKDKRQKGHQPRGEQIKQSRLKEADVIQMRQLRSTGIAFRQIARQFGVTYASVWRAVNKKTWNHVN